jgi:hypothetical protein
MHHASSSCLHRDTVNKKSWSNRDGRYEHRSWRIPAASGSP